MFQGIAIERIAGAEPIFCSNQLFEMWPELTSESLQSLINFIVLSVMSRSIRSQFKTQELEVSCNRAYDLSSCHLGSSNGVSPESDPSKLQMDTI